MKELVLDSIFFKDKGRKILNGCFLKVIPKSVTCLIGKNGSGKSTLMKVGAGVIDPNSGITIIDNKRLHKPSKLIRYKYLAYLSQEPFLPKEIKVSNILNNNEKVRAEDALLDRIFDSKVKDLSYGEVRYLEIIFVLSQNRKYVFLDEPFTGLAPKLIEEVIKKILIKKREGSGILISDHYINYLLDITDSIYYISNEETTLIESNKGFKAELKRIGYLK